MAVGERTTSRGIAARGDHRQLVFRRPAELVDVSERVYRDLFAVGLWLAVGFTALGLLDSLLQPPGSLVRGVFVCGACLPAMVVAATCPAVLYRRVRRFPGTLLVPAAVLGVGAFIVGPYNFQIFLSGAPILAAIGIAAPLRVVAAAGLIAAAGLAAPQIIEGRPAVAGALAVTVPPVMVWLIVDRVAGFALRLHRALGDAAAATSPPRGMPDAPTDPAYAPKPPRRGDRRQRALGGPRVVTTEGVRLTSRQLQVILLACEGLRHAEIGACLGIGPQQVRRHLHEARRRTGSNSVPQLIDWAFRSGLAPRDWASTSR